jgi:hypothetical protein
MVRRPRPTHLDEVLRVLVLWAQPSHLSAEEAEAWARTELGHVTRLPAVAHAELSRLGSASEAHARPGDWMLELHVADAEAAAGCCRAPELREWLADLRLLGMRPAAAVATATGTEQAQSA